MNDPIKKTKNLAQSSDKKAGAIDAQSGSYRLAFEDTQFIARKEARGIRFQLELLKPELEQEEKGIHNTVVVFGSARFVDKETAQQSLVKARQSGDEQAICEAELALKNADYYEKARIFANLVAHDCASQPASHRFVICTGGGPGIMEAANRGAHEAGALNVGLNITLPHEQSGNRYISEGLSFKFQYFALRKMHFLIRAKAFVAFPGGFGTLDELFEVLTLVQTHKSRRLPIVLFGKEFWNGLLNFDALVEHGTIKKSDLDLFCFSDDPAQAWEHIKSFYREEKNSNLFMRETLMSEHHHDDDHPELGHHGE